MKHNGEWIDEMVNNRKVSSVACLKWSPDGSKICIAYEDGHVIVGGVEGNRKWGKDLNKNIKHIAWAPDSRLLVIGTKLG
jgi:WD repeat-containing protein 35